MQQCVSCCARLGCRKSIFLGFAMCKLPCVQADLTFDTHMSVTCSRRVSVHRCFPFTEYRCRAFLSYTHTHTHTHTHPHTHTQKHQHTPPIRRTTPTHP